MQTKEDFYKMGAQLAIDELLKEGGKVELAEGLAKKLKTWNPGRMRGPVRLSKHQRLPFIFSGLEKDVKFVPGKGK